MPVSQMSAERVLCIPTLLFHELGHFQGFLADAQPYFKTLFDPNYTTYRPRDEVETDPSYKQLIPYCIFRSRGEAEKGCVSVSETAALFFLSVICE